MTDPSPADPGADPGRGGAPVAMRLLRGLGTVGAIGIGGALFVALQPQRQTTGSEHYNTGNRSTPDGLANLPRDYTGLPRNVPPLGPPLPGDLGRPMLNAGAAPNAVVPVAPSVDAEAQRRAQEVEAARVSRLFASTNIRQPPAVNLPSIASPDMGGAAALPAPPSSDATFDQNGQDRKLAFARSADGQPRLACRPRVSLRGAGRHRYPGRADHRHSVRLAGADHGPGDRGRLR